MNARSGPSECPPTAELGKKDWHQRLGGGVHADAIMDRIVHNTIWIETGNTNMREHTATKA
ncbi:ATP-binding protein [Propioniciclava tarda]|uniref:ATP-binding protein n=1 Tax=Propioniciclava tarda TaxID=433330 RepID=UPI003BA91872